MVREQLQPEHMGPPVIILFLTLLLQLAVDMEEETVVEKPEEREDQAEEDLLQEQIQQPEVRLHHQDREMLEVVTEDISYQAIPVEGEGEPEQLEELQPEMVTPETGESELKMI